MASISISSIPEGYPMVSTTIAHDCAENNPLAKLKHRSGFHRFAYWPQVGCAWWWRGFTSSKFKQHHQPNYNFDQFY